jgi:hypothetical protein
MLAKLAKLALQAAYNCLTGSLLKIEGVCGAFAYLH